MKKRGGLIFSIFFVFLIIFSVSVYAEINQTASSTFNPCGSIVSPLIKYSSGMETYLFTYIKGFISGSNQEYNNFYISVSFGYNNGECRRIYDVPIDSYKVYESVDGSSFELVKTLDSSSYGYIGYGNYVVYNYDLIEGSIYSYYVVAYSSDGTIEKSNVVSTKVSYPDCNQGDEDENHRLGFNIYEEGYGDSCISDTTLREDLCKPAGYIGPDPALIDCTYYGAVCSGAACVVPDARCGDGVCNPLEETCSGCPQDCIKHEMFNCETGQFSCADSDGDLNYGVLGYVSGVYVNTLYKYFDECSDTDSSILRELYCEGSRPGYKLVNCDDIGYDGCSGGKCVGLLGETPINDTEPPVINDTLLPSNETPINETPINETPINETPINETPINETPINETPINETPINETPINETPINETPINETPINETPINETPEEPPEQNQTCNWLPPGLMKEDKYPYGLAKQGKIPGGWLNKCPEPGINSDSFFYDFDLAMEKTMLALAPTENAKAELSSKYADERLAELVVKMEEGDRESVYRLVEEYESQMSKTKQFIEAAKNKGDYSPEVDKVSAESLLVHEIILEEAIDESDSLLSYGEVVIGELVDSYSEARDEAVARLEEEAPGKAAEVHLQVARRKLEKVRDKSEFEYRVVDGKIEKVYEEFEQEEVVEIGSLVGDYLETIDKVDILIDESESNGEEINGVGELVESEETYEDIVTLVEIYSVVGELDKEEVSMAVEASFELKEKVSEKVQEQKQRKEEEKLQKQEEKGEKEVEKEEKQEEKETNSNKEESSTKAKENKETKAQGKGKGLTGSAILDWFSGLFN